jgi:hypothetical protein
MRRMAVRGDSGSPTTTTHRNGIWREEGDGSAPWIFVAHLFRHRVDDGQVSTSPCLLLNLPARTSRVLALLDDGRGHVSTVRSCQWKEYAFWVRQSEGDGESEFLTHKTTCASEMLEKTTCRKICQKRPLRVAGTAGQATRGTCRLGRRRHGGAATANAGTSAAIDDPAPPRHPAATAKGGMACHVILPPLPKAAWPTTVTACLRAGLGDGGTPHAGVGPGGTCHVSPGQMCRHPQGVLFDKNFRRWSFLAFHSRRWSDASKIRGKRQWQWLATAGLLLVAVEARNHFSVCLFLACPCQAATTPRWARRQSSYRM